MNFTDLPWPTINPRARDEWDFGKNRLPEEEVDPCHFYEAARMRWSDPPLANIRAFREQSDAKDYGSLCRQHDAWTRGDPRKSLPLYALWPEWPSAPYLSVSRKERLNRIAHIDRDQPAEVLHQVPLNEFLADAAKEFPRLQSVAAKLNPPPSVPELYRSTFGPTIPIPDKGLELVGLLIRSDWTEKEFVNRALNWYREHCKTRGVKAEFRGSSKLGQQLRADLKAIGFWRLVQSGMSRSEVAAFTAKIAGEPLFSYDSSRWTKALKRAESVIGSPPLECF
jgi:hypothetical protein